MLCRLCLKEQEDVLLIFGDLLRTPEATNMAEIIAKHFSFKPKPDDSISKVICKECWSKVIDFHEFHQVVEEGNRNLILRQCGVEVKKENDVEESMAADADEACMDQLPVDVQIVVEPVHIKNEENHISHIADEELIDEPIPFSNESDTTDGDAFDALESAKDLNIGAANTAETLPRRLASKCYRKKPLEDERQNDTDIDENLPLSKLKRKTCGTKAKNRRKRVKKETCEKNTDGDVDTDAEASVGHDHDGMADKYKNNADDDDKDKSKRDCINEVKSHDRKSASFQEKIRKVDEAIGAHASLNCDVCETKQITFAKLVKHMKTEHDMEKGYAICCERKYTNRQKLYDHVQIHINPDCYKCNDCGRQLGNATSLRQHMLTKHQPDEAKPFECKDCFKRYATEKLLKKHAVKHDERTHICEKCQKAFPSSGLLAQHTKISHDGYGIMCDICAKIFPGPAAFEKHQLQHKGIVPPKLQCDICFTWHKDKDCLRMHRSRHNQEGKLHMCGFCGKVAPNRIAMLKHQRDVHTSKRKFQCTFCDKGFKRAIHLREHMTSHTGEALYNCPHCPRTFNNSGNMHSHRKKMHPIEFEEARRNRLEMRKMPPPNNGGVGAIVATPQNQEAIKT